MKSTLSRIKLDEIDFRFLVPACLLLACKIGNEEIFIESICSVMFEMLESLKGVGESLPDAREFSAAIASTESQILCLLEFRISAFNSTSVEFLLYQMRKMGWGGRLVGETVALLNDLMLLQQSRCFKERHLAAVALLLAIGSADRPPPRVAWWKVFGLSWANLLLVTSLLAPDLAEFKKNLPKLRVSPLQMLPPLAKVVDLQDPNDAALSGSENSRPSSPLNPNIAAYQTEGFQNRDNRFISLDDNDSPPRNLPTNGNSLPQESSVPRELEGHVEAHRFLGKRFIPGLDDLSQDQEPSRPLGKRFIPGLDDLSQDQEPSRPLGKRFIPGLDDLSQDSEPHQPLGRKFIPGLDDLSQDQEPSRPLGRRFIPGLEDLPQDAERSLPLIPATKKLPFRASDLSGTHAPFAIKTISNRSLLSKNDPFSDQLDPEESGISPSGSGRFDEDRQGAGVASKRKQKSSKNMKKGSSGKSITRWE